VTPKICVSIKPKNNDDALSLIEKVEVTKADFIEIRLDNYKTPKFTDLVASTKIPLIATNKLPCEMGSFTGTATQRWQNLMDAANSGFQYVDLELTSLMLKEHIIDLKKLNTKAIVSSHNFNGAFTVVELQRILDKESDMGADVCKIVGTAIQAQDNLDVLNFVSENSNKTQLVCFCMGEQGRISRLLSPAFGAFFTFATLKQGSETAPGQISINEMRTAYSLLRQ
jgi:3-dehydroquinate dehydratase type I